MPRYAMAHPPVECGTIVAKKTEYRIPEPTKSGKSYTEVVAGGDDLDAQYKRQVAQRKARIEKEEAEAAERIALKKAEFAKAAEERAAQLAEETAAFIRKDEEKAAEQKAEKDRQVNLSAQKHK